MDEATLRPKEILDKRLKAIDELRAADFGATPHGRDVLDRNEAAARKDFNESSKLAHHAERQPEGNQALLAGSSEAFSAIFRAQRNTDDGKLARQQVSELQKIRQAAEKQLKAFANAQPVIVGEMPV